MTTLTTVNNLLLEYGRLEYGSHEAGLRQAIHTQHTFEVKTVALMATIIIIIIIITEHYRAPITSKT